MRTTPLLLVAAIAIAACGSKKEPAPTGSGTTPPSDGAAPPSGGGAPSTPPIAPGEQPPSPTQPPSPPGLTPSDIGPGGGPIDGGPSPTPAPPGTGTPAAPPPTPPPPIASPCELSVSLGGAPALEATAPRHPLPAWEHRPAAGTRLRWDGVLDADGNLYWTELAEDGTGEVVSATRAGQIRWRAPTAHLAAHVVLVADGVVVALSQPTIDAFSVPGTWLEAFRAADGAPLWTRDVVADAAPLVPEAAGPARAYVGETHPAAADGTLVLSLTALGAEGYQYPGVLRVDLRSGALLSRRSFEGARTIWMSSPAAIARDGTLVFSASTDVAGATLYATAPGGADLFAIPQPSDHASWLANVSDRFAFVQSFPDSRFLPDGGPAYVDWLRLEDGARAGRATGVSGEVLSEGGFAYSFGIGTVARLDLDGCAVGWQRTIAAEPPGDRSTHPHLTTAVTSLTADGGVLVLSELDVYGATSLDVTLGTAALIAIGPDGVERWRAELPVDALYGGPGALHGGRWFVAPLLPDRSTAVLRAFDVGIDAAEPGWIAQDGGFSRTRRAR
ncbi:hypothetical protein [Anaeromyxobacter terrae]|uniref:hypothetical protein n=1 Tax=Anaeromyxobacter terrae TaxID=2925406 RepID=UPI001F582C45|nr:hypothetical protein [Anaeromyxobacter sp. SG22]